MEKPVVSIVMATWNRAGIISQAIESVCKQTFQEWELLIVDDGSPDNTAEVVTAWEKKEKRIKYLRMPRVGNIAGVSNAAIRAAHGEFIAILDDDDYWIDTQKLAKQVAFMRSHPDYIACGGWFIAVDKDSKEVARLKKPETDEAIRRVMLSANAIANGTSMFRRAEAGFYDEKLKGYADWDFFLRIGKIGKLCNLPEYFLGYRMWDRSGSVVDQKKNVAAALVIIERYKNDYPRFYQAVILARLHWVYAQLPLPIRQGTHAFLSRLKKLIFSR
jgi:glycosyltransferase involved in cell wall biosynthesis